MSKQNEVSFTIDNKVFRLWVKLGKHKFGFSKHDIGDTDEKYYTFSFGIAGGNFTIYG